MLFTPRAANRALFTPFEGCLHSKQIVFRRVCQTYNVTFGLAGATGETARSMDWPERNRLAGSVSLELLRKSGFSAALRLDGETMGSAHSAGAASAELRWTW